MIGDAICTIQQSFAAPWDLQFKKYKQNTQKHQKKENLTL